MKMSQLEARGIIPFAIAGLMILAVVGLVVFVKKDIDHGKEPGVIRFRFGDRVYIPEGFYRGSKGRVISCRYWNREYTSCEVDITFISADGRYTRTQDATFRQEDLLEDRSE